MSKRLSMLEEAKKKFPMPLSDYIKLDVFSVRVRFDHALFGIIAKMRLIDIKRPKSADYWLKPLKDDIWAQMDAENALLAMPIAGHA